MEINHMKSGHIQLWEPRYDCLIRQIIESADFFTNHDPHGQQVGMEISLLFVDISKNKQPSKLNNIYGIRVNEDR